MRMSGPTPDRGDGATAAKRFFRARVGLSSPSRRASATDRDRSFFFAKVRFRSAVSEAVRYRDAMNFARHAEASSCIAVENRSGKSFRGRIDCRNGRMPCGMLQARKGDGNRFSAGSFRPGGSVLPEFGRHDFGVEHAHAGIETFRKRGFVVLRVLRNGWSGLGGCRRIAFRKR